MMIRTFFISLISFIALSLSAQESRKTVILYNVVPLSVELLPDGTIKTIYGKAEHFFKGYQLVKREQYFSPSANNDKYAEMTTDVIVSTDIFRMPFDEQVALLNENTIAALDQIKNMLFTNPDKKILISSYTIDQTNKREVILLQNRLASCLSYLDIMGVSKDQIVIDGSPQINQNNVITATAIVKSEFVSENNNQN
jgi:hypothetical protein